eukprot:gb/GEZN01005237.1/.p1 GENE.gb/GEZN01005237.1/~~gb/GEZN01005237.1/.p1  ORF type:complete len:438 (-),score=29.90 gb/GEZN01005237.1/:397-1710(-)
MAARSFQAMRRFARRDVATLLLNARKSGVNHRSRTFKRDDSPVTVLDLLVQYLTCVKLQQLFPGEKLIAEEQIDFKELREGVRLHPQLENLSYLLSYGEGPLEVCIPRSPPGVSGLNLGTEPIWVLDPIDGTRDFATGGNQFCFSLARLERRAGRSMPDDFIYNNRELSGSPQQRLATAVTQPVWFPSYALISAPAFTGRAPRIPSEPTLELTHNEVRLYNGEWRHHSQRRLHGWTEDPSMAVPYHIDLPTSSNRFSMRHPHRISHCSCNTLRNHTALSESASQQIASYEAVQNTVAGSFPAAEICNHSCPAAMELMRVALGESALFFNPNIRLWDHAAGLGIVHALGGGALRIDGTTWEGYTEKDLQDALEDKSSPLIVTAGHGRLAGLVQHALEVENRKCSCLASPLPPRALPPSSSGHALMLTQRADTIQLVKS